MNRHSEILARRFVTQVQKKVPGLRFAVATFNFDTMVGVGLFAGQVRHGVVIAPRARRIDRSIAFRAAKVLRSVRRTPRTLPRIRAA